MFPGGWRRGCPRVWYEPPAPIPGNILKKWPHNAHILTVILQKECRLKFMLKDKTFVQTNVSHQHSAPPSKLRCAVKKRSLATDDLVEFPHHSSKLVFTLRSQYKCVWDCMHLISFEVHWEYFGWNGLTDYDDSSRKFPVTRLIADLWAAIENVMAGHRNLFKT